MITDIHTHNPLHPAAAVRSVAPEQLPPAPLPGRLFSVGLHPWDTAALSPSALEAQLRAVASAASRPDVVAVGEAGIDALRGAPAEVQTEVFRRQAQISEQAGKPLVLHVVKRWDDVLALRKAMRPKQPWIVHGFRGNAPMARQLLNAGLYLSFGARFNSDALREVPLDHLLAETDESTIGIDEVVNSLAEALSIPPSELGAQIARNAARIMRIE